MQYANLKTVNGSLTYAIMSDALILAYVQLVMTELQKVLSQDLKCLCSKITTVLL